MSNASTQPIYEQIASQIKTQIINGKLPEGMLLPSIRNLAKDLRISVITTKRAYDELERGGFIHTIQGKGTYIAPKNIDLIREENLRNIEEHMRLIMRSADMCNLGDEELFAMYQLLREGDAYQ